MAVRWRYRCHFCGHIFPAWRPDGVMLLYHLGQQHPDQLGLYLSRMRTESIAMVALEAYEEG